MRGVGSLVVAVFGACGDGSAATDASADSSAVDGPPVTSCRGLPNNCGPQANRSCCESREVPGGTFYREYDGTADYSNMTYQATVSRFGLDTYEVTVARFRQFVEAGGGTQQSPPAAGDGAHQNIANSGWNATWNTSLPATTANLIADIRCDGTYQTWTNTPSGNENRPINCINWFVAFAFCAWDGGFLPTEAELMYAAVGGSLQRAYPWSSPHTDVTIDCTRANFGGSNWPPTACVPVGANTVGATSPTGDGVWGHADVAGNVWEWGLDWSAAWLDPCTDCANLTPATERVIHGGSFSSNAIEERAPKRSSVAPDVRNPDFGVRCARP